LLSEWESASGEVQHSLVAKCAEIGRDCDHVVQTSSRCDYLSEQIQFLKCIIEWSDMISARDKVVVARVTAQTPQERKNKQKKKKKTEFHSQAKQLRSQQAALQVTNEKNNLCRKQTAADLAEAELIEIECSSLSFEIARLEQETAASSAALQTL
jgi:hypothetical protein